jgi:hypothetical protein
MRILLGTILGLAIAGSPLLAHQEPADKEKRKQQEPKAQEPPKTHEPPAQPKATPEKRQEPPEKKQEAPPSAKQEKSDEKRQAQDPKQQQKEAEKQSKETDKNNRENNQAPQARQREQSNRQQYARGSHARSERIPPQKFDEHFGSEHHFRVWHLEEGRRFEYSGYAFEVVEPWPSDWSYDDECYIEQDEDDYYLVDVFHPGIRVLVIVV